MKIASIVGDIQIQSDLEGWDCSSWAKTPEPGLGYISALEFAPYGQATPPHIKMADAAVGHAGTLASELSSRS